MKKTRELRQHGGLNHTELMNVVLEGVQEAMKDVLDPTFASPIVKHVNVVLGVPSAPPDIMAQINEIHQAMNQMQQLMLAPKQSEQQQQQPIPPQNMYQNYQNTYNPHAQPLNIQ